MEEVSRIINAQEVSISKSDIEDAFERTEARLDSDNFEFRYSPWHFIDIDGVRKPINDVFWNIPGVQDAANSKDDIHSIQEVFTKLGFELYSRKEHAEEILRDTFEEILEDYPSRTSTASKDKRLYQLLVNKAPNFVKHIANKNFDEKFFEFKGSAGQGNWPNIPWVAAKHPDETSTTQKGVYIVYLFDPERQVVYATLNQGTTEVIKRYGKRDGREILENRAEKLREKLDLTRFNTENPSLSDNSKLYEESTIYQKKYELGDLPSADQIGKDFVSLAEAYLDYIEIKDDFEVEKSNSERNIEDFNNKQDETGSRNYFWVNAKPARWRVESIKDGGTAFYTAYNKKGNKRNNFRAFKKASKGDKVVFYESQPTQKVLATGEVSEGLHEEDREGYNEPVKGVSLKYSKPVDEIPWDELESSDYLNEVIPIESFQGSLFEITEEAYNRILNYEEYKNREPEIDAGEALSIDLDLEFEDLYFPDDQDKNIISQIQASLNSGKHIIFTGPPGTGKTEIAEAVASELEEKESNVTGFEMTTATADWSTFDTVGGFMPEKNGDGDLKFNSGQILNRFRDDKNPVKNEALIIDEINRADIDKAFGQLFTLLSGQGVQLPYTADNGKEIEVIPGKDAPERPEDHQYVMPESWRILATMNSYDKTSLYEMSYAFMRRFAFIRVDAPDDNLDDHIRDYNERWEIEADESDLDAVADIWERTNSQDGRKIGPAIAEDMLGFVSEGCSPTDAVINFVFPQLEGVRGNGDIVREIAKSNYVEETKLRNVAREMLQVKFDEEN